MVSGSLGFQTRAVIFACQFDCAELQLSKLDDKSLGLIRSGFGSTWYVLPGRFGNILLDTTVSSKPFCENCVFIVIFVGIIPVIVILVIVILVIVIVIGGYCHCCGPCCRNHSRQYCCCCRHCHCHCWTLVAVILVSIIFIVLIGC